MPAEMTDAIDTSYAPYSEEESYREANEPLIALLELGDVRRVADLACGTGLLSQLLLARKPRLAICGVDLDPQQVGIAERHFAAAGVPLGSLEDFRAAGRAENAVVHLRVHSADALPFADGEIDLVLMGNAIHLMPDKPAFLAEVARVLRPGGRFVFNSVFYVGTFPPGAGAVFTEWLKEATVVLSEINQERRDAGLPPVPRQRGKGARAFGKGWLSAEDWTALVAASGLKPIRTAERPVPISRAGLELVGSYGGLAEVLMSGYPVEIASACLKKAVGRTFDRLGIEEAPRNWLEVIAVRE